jgi:hypothetical protein
MLPWWCPKDTSQDAEPGSQETVWKGTQPRLCIILLKEWGS